MKVKSKPSFTVISPGMLTTIQDCGRFRQAHLGITTGGAADNNAFMCANQLLKNSEDAPALEINFGGLQLIANSATTIAITGAQAPISINGEVKANWQCHHLNKNDKLDIGFATSGCRIYLAVSGGFIVPSQFGSTSTVIREKLGGFDGGAIKTGQILPIGQTEKIPLNKINSHYIPKYSNQLNLRVITGYQISSFSRQQVNKFFASEYQVSSQSDRMGYRLTGPKITSEISSMYSEGICQGAIQIPPDGQPIVLANDRQTIGGYPKLGSVLSIDLNNLMQSPQGTKIHFEPISIHCAHTLLHLAKAKLTNVPLIQGMS
ncbi:biotin-dependent carboxyltransferase family protein [Paraglaciecola aquimarina]|uniref:Biotin-dependent carboxyltransferase family protein n=1 Tax=Paraglaciecola algarum TaxID=3050085 RepID=A0ABS9D4F2_9ALTE|nr:biotin-dependent carboxyltransferase family protein [Paraglaciecola sp. G1-23]MCF2947795.1 biotin-dependent carboxyltransferase family protein [Paraglaciecola sp. G1-23]